MHEWMPPTRTGSTPEDHVVPTVVAATRASSTAGSVARGRGDQPTTPSAATATGHPDPPTELLTYIEESG